MIVIGRDIEWTHEDARIVIEILESINLDLSSIDSRMSNLSDEDRRELRRFLGTMIGSILSEIIIPAREQFDDL